MIEGEHAVAVDGGEKQALEREIEACDVRLRFLTQAGYDESRLGPFRTELLERRREAEDRLAAIGGAARA